MQDPNPSLCRYFLSYSGASLPPRLVTELAPEQLENRNTYFRGFFDDADRLIRLQKIVYAEVEMEQRYAYHANGRVRRVEIVTDEEDGPNIREFDEEGHAIDG